MRRGSQYPPPDLASELNISDLFLDILWRRGMTTREQIDSYLTARLNQLTPPAQWPRIPEAARILGINLLTGKKMAVWGDYDVDGITATTLVLDVLEAHGFEAEYHLPDRRKEGYGLNVPGIEDLAARGCKTLLTVDCGISNWEAIRRAGELGMTVIVSDHHLPPEALPDAAAIVNPRMEEVGTWPCANLAGVGVAFYLMAALNAFLAPHTGSRYKMDLALDLVALGTLADVMLLEGENRLLVRGGLARIGKAPRPGLAALKKVSDFDVAAELTSGQAVFRLAPRINAAGRMGHPNLALNLLRSRDYREAVRLAEELNDCNSERKREEDKIHLEARTQAAQLLAEKNYTALTLFGADWHPGIIGIVASRIVEEFNRPTMVLCEENGTLKGSGRSLPGFDLHGSLGEVSQYLLGYGGHTMAAGVSMDPNCLADFRNAFSDVARDRLGEYPPEPVLKLDRKLDFAQASDHSFLRELQLMQPFGPGNSEPVFMSPPLKVKKLAPLGFSGEHVRLELEDTSTGITLGAKAWRMADKFPAALVGQQILLAYTPRIDSYKGLPTIDLGIKDWRLAKAGNLGPQ